MAKACDSFVDTLNIIIDEFQHDEHLDEIVFNGAEFGFLISQKSQIFKKPPFQNNHILLDWLMEFVAIQNLRLDPNHPATGGSYNTYFRWHAIHPCVSGNGPLFSIRKHRFGSLSFADFKLSDKHRKKIETAMHQGHHILIHGNTSSGKSSLLYCLLECFCDTERLIIIESLRELVLKNPLWISLQQRFAGYDGLGSFTCQQLISEALRLRPDRIILGEIRSADVLSFMELLQISHNGVIATVHGNEPKAIAARFSHFSGRYQGQAIDQGPSPPANEIPVLWIKMERGVTPWVSSVTDLYL